MQHEYLLSAGIFTVLIPLISRQITIVICVLLWVCAMFSLLMDWRVISDYDSCIIRKGKSGCGNDRRDWELKFINNHSIWQLIQSQWKFFGNSAKCWILVNGQSKVGEWTMALFRSSLQLTSADKNPLVKKHFWIFLQTLRVFAFLFILMYSL